MCENSFQADSSYVKKDMHANLSKANLWNYPASTDTCHSVIGLIINVCICVSGCISICMYVCICVPICIHNYVFVCGLEHCMHIAYMSVFVSLPVFVFGASEP